MYEWTDGHMNGWTVAHIAQSRCAIYIIDFSNYFSGQTFTFFIIQLLKGSNLHEVTKLTTIKNSKIYIDDVHNVKPALITLL